MRPSPPNGAARGRARGGVAPALLLDVLTAAGDIFYFSDRELTGIPPALVPLPATPAQSNSSIRPIEVIDWYESSASARLIFAQATGFPTNCRVVLNDLTELTFLNGVEGTLSFFGENRFADFMPLMPISHADEDGGVNNGTAKLATDLEAAMGVVHYLPWLLNSGTLSFNRSLQTDTGALTLQNLSGDVLQSDWERLTRRSTFEGALFVLRWYQVDMEWAWLEQHGTLTVGDTSRSTVQLSLQQLMQGQDDTPEQQVSETCQLVWGEKRCGATGPTECLYTYSSCQVVEHFVGIQTAFEANNPATAANLPVTPINRKRAW